jgi:hypothetical protein
LIVVRFFSVDRWWNEIGGGGIFAYLTTGTLTNCIISGNYSGIFGGGVELRDASPSISNCTNSTTLTNANATYTTDQFMGKLINVDTTQRFQAVVPSNIATIGIVVFKEELNLLKIASLALIILGVVGLQLSSNLHQS